MYNRWNGKGPDNASVGLLSYDEVVYAGGYYGKDNSKYYLYNSAIHWWTMSPVGFSGSLSAVWYVRTSGDISINRVYDASCLRAVLNLKADTMVTGIGTGTDPFVIK